MTDDRSSEELSERAVWRAEALAVSAGLGVLGLAYAGFLILDRLAPDSWTWVVRSLTAVAGFWVSARVYRRVLRRRRFKSDALGVPSGGNGRAQWR